MIRYRSNVSQFRVSSSACRNRIIINVNSTRTTSSRQVNSLRRELRHIHLFQPSTSASNPLICRATEQPSSPPEAQKTVIAGMDATRGFFGFVPFSELWVGRWAMMGFASGLFVELATGKGILKQVGLESPNKGILILLAVVMGGATLAGTGVTIARAISGTMSKEEIADYATFLGLKGEKKALKSESDEMKRGGDFTSIQSMEEIEEARQLKDTPADKFLSQDNLTEIEKSSNEMKDSDTFAQTADAMEIDSYLKRSEMAEEAYAREVEMANGRWAMIGFAAAIIIEAATGQGIIGQLIGYGKLSGLLGDMSGF